MKETPQPCINCLAKCPEGYNPFNPDCEVIQTPPKYLDPTSPTEKEVPSTDEEE